MVTKFKKQIIERDKNKCNCCNKIIDIKSNVLDTLKKHSNIVYLDHIIPTALGGKDEMNNIQTLCYICNKNKTRIDLKNIYLYKKTKQHQVPKT